MMKLIRLIALAAITLLESNARAALTAAVNVSPYGAAQGAVVTVLLQVSNTSGANAVTSVAATLSASMGSVIQLSGPIPAAANLSPGTSVDFIYTFSISGCGGPLSFTGSAQGSELSAPVGSNQASSTQFTPACPTATPTPAPTVIVPTEIPAFSEAKILGNKFHPGPGKSVGFRVTLPYGGLYRISIYDRQGQKLKFIEREGVPGVNEEYWDGRSDQGSYFSTGIYAVHFNGKGLDKVAKIVVIK